MLPLEQMRDSSYVNPELEKILQKGPVSSLDAAPDIQTLRKALQARKLALTAANDSANPSDITETDHEVTTRDGAKIVARVYQGPKSKDGPCMVMLHGGGFCLGGLDNEALLCREWCRQANGVSVNVDYRLAPEYKFPTAVFDSYDAVKWTAENAGLIEADLSKAFIVAGISAGANISCSISHLARDDSLQPPLTGVYLSIPSIISPETVPEKYRAEFTSREDNKDAPILNDGAMKMFRKNYGGDDTSPLMAPVAFETGHGGLPRTYFQICGMDPLRDDGLIYDRILREEHGLKTKVDLYPGLPHGFWSWWPEAKFSQKQQQDSVKGLLWLLESSS